MTLPRLSPERFRVLAVVALVAVSLIVVTGGAVRVTGSGLGCSSWPNCEPGHLVGAVNHHQLVEQANRFVSGVVVVVSVLTLLGALGRTPRRRDLSWLAGGLVGGVLGQVVLGGLTVVFDLRPGLVMAHFLLSMALIVDAAVLLRRSGYASGETISVVRPEVTALTRLLVGLGAAVLVLGTVVTGTGPHSGDAHHAARFGVDLRTVAQAHADAVMVVIGLTAALGVLLAVTDTPVVVRRRYRWLAVVVVAQAAVGFTQYALHLPSALVEVHILGATVFWVATLSLALSTRAGVAAIPTQALSGQETTESVAF